MAMRRFSKNEKILIALALGAVGSYFISRGLGFISSSPSVNLTRQIQIKKKLIANAVSLLDQKQEILEESDMYAQYTLPPSAEDYTPQLLKELAAMAETAQVQLIDLKPGPSQKTDYYLEYMAEVEVEASLVQFVAFLYSIQDSKNLLKIEKLRVGPKVDKPEHLKAYLTIAKPTVL